jgi:hypothetical protein
MMKTTIPCLTVIVSAFLPFTLMAGIGNGSFETPTVTSSAQYDTYYGGTSFAGWTVRGNGVPDAHAYVALCANGLYGADCNASDGLQFVGFNVGTLYDTGVSMEQVLSTVPGVTYTVNFDITGFGTTGFGSSCALSLSASALRPDGTAINSTKCDVTAPDGWQYVWNWETHTLTFTALDDLTTLSFLDTSTGDTTSADVCLDKVTVTPIQLSITGIPVNFPLGGGEQILGTVDITQPLAFSVVSATATLRDQGWGGSDPVNGMFVDIYTNNTLLYRIATLGSGRADQQEDPDHLFYTPTWTASAAELATLNLTVARIDWASSPAVQIRLVANAMGYPGWSLEITSSSLTATAMPSTPIKLTISMVDEGSVRIQFNGTQSATKYTVEISDSLLAGSWTELGTAQETSSGTFELIDHSPVTGVRFYRVVAK